MTPIPANVSESVRRRNPHLYPTSEGDSEMARDAVAKESDLHYAIIDRCRDLGWIYLHGSMAEVTHRTEGEPDFVILADNGVVWFIECKSKTGKLSPKQQAMQAHAKKLGHTVHVVRSMQEFEELTGA